MTTRKRGGGGWPWSKKPNAPKTLKNQIASNIGLAPGETANTFLDDHGVIVRAGRETPTTPMSSTQQALMLGKLIYYLKTEGVELNDSLLCDVVRNSPFPVYNFMLEYREDRVGGEDRVEGIYLYKKGKEDAYMVIKKPQGCKDGTPLNRRVNAILAPYKKRNDAMNTKRANNNALTRNRMASQASYNANLQGTMADLLEKYPNEDDLRKHIASMETSPRKLDLQRLAKKMFTKSWAKRLFGKGITRKAGGGHQEELRRAKADWERAGSPPFSEACEAGLGHLRAECYHNAIKADMQRKAGKGSRHLV